MTPPAIIALSPAPAPRPHSRYAGLARANPERARPTDVDSLLKKFAQSSQLGANAAFIEDLYEQYLVDPGSVGDRWKAWFDGFKGREAGDVPHSVVMDAVARAGREARKGVVVSAGGGDQEAQRKQGSVLKLITAYRSRGHLRAATDPLGMSELPEAPDLELPFHG